MTFVSGLQSEASEITAWVLLQGLSRVWPRAGLGPAWRTLRLAKEEACQNDMLVQIKWQGRKMAVPLSQLAAVNPDESTAEAIGDWHYWVSQAYLF